jgi:hypothetical protein
MSTPFVAKLRAAGIVDAVIETLMHNEVDGMETLVMMEKSDLLHLGLKMGTVIKLVKLASSTAQTGG